MSNQAAAPEHGAHGGERGFTKLDFELNDYPGVVKTSLFGSLSPSRMAVDLLMAVIIQREDVESASSALTKLGFTLTRMPTHGGFLNRQNITLLVGLAHGQEGAALNALNASCRQRIVHLSTPVEGMPVSMAAPVEVTIGGATIFTFVVERFEVF